MFFNIVLSLVALLVLVLGFYAVRGLMGRDAGYTAKLMLWASGLFAGGAVLAFLASLVRG